MTWSTSTRRGAGGLLLLLLATLLGAAPVGESESLAAVRGWLRASPSALGVPLSARPLAPVTQADAAGQPLFRVVPLEPEGFVLTSTDTEIEPIVAFAGEGCFEPSPDHPLFRLLERDLGARRAALGDSVGRSAVAPAAAAKKWSQLLALGARRPVAPMGNGLSSVDDPRVDPLIQSRWSQSTIWDGQQMAACYNYHTPPFAAGNRSNYVAGCVATAWGQIFRFHRYPTQAVGTAQFNIEVDGVPTVRRLRGGDGLGGPYLWDLMPLQPGAGTTQAEREAVGALLADIGAAARTSYAADGSGAWLTEVEVQSVFHFENVAYLAETGSAFANAIRACLDAALPTMLSISGTAGGHALVLDGYGFHLSTPYYHLNLGWGGTKDAWYNLPSVDTDYYTFTVVDGCFYNLYPSGTGEIVSGRVTDEAGQPIAGVEVRVQGSSTIPSATTSTRGIYALARLAQRTTFTLTAARAGFTFPTQTVTTGASDRPSRTGNRWGIDFTGGVLPVEPPVLTSYVHVGAAFVVTLTTAAGHTYTLEAADAVAGPVWSAVGTLAGDGSAQLLGDPAPPIGPRFYRVRVDP